MASISQSDTPLLFEAESMTDDVASSPLSQLVTNTDNQRRAGDALQGLVRAAREHLGMEVSFISEFTDGQRVFRYVDSSVPGPVEVGGADPLESSYCQRIVDGRLPELIRDAQALPAAMELAVTAALPVGAHMSVPLRLPDGRLYGTFCCFSRQIDHSLNSRDVAVMRVFADVAGAYLEADLATAEARQRTRVRIASALADEGVLTTVFQPVISVADGRTIGVEALSRFVGEEARTPDVWFAEAELVGLGVELELAALRSALAVLPDLPVDAFLGVNISPGVAESRELHEALADVDVQRLVLEMTEHVPVDDYHRLAAALLPLRRRGLAIAVDDAGAGYASLRHILWLTPDWIKLDISITRNVDHDPARAALAAALIRFATEVGSKIIAEGVETKAELDALRGLGATAAQGYHLARPAARIDAIGAKSEAVV
jgi:EAL domain-containing protein (putative c-di-GMP-specific phosphodiesterase class I)